jgi:hypothetical protein
MLRNHLGPDAGHESFAIPAGIQNSGRREGLSCGADQWIGIHARPTTTKALDAVMGLRPTAKLSRGGGCPSQ